MTVLTNAECKGLVTQNAVLGLACFLGIIANLILLGFSLKNGRGGLSPDKLLITNFAVADLVALLFSLPLHVKALNGSSDLADNNVCLARFFIMFTCFAVNIMTLATIGIDRYDAICRAPVHKITCQKTAQYITLIWLFACFTVVPGGIGHILTAIHGKHVCGSPGRAFDDNAHTGKSVMLAVVALWIVPSLCIMFNRFYGIVKYVREHSSHLRLVLGTTSAKREVKLTRICVVMMTTYLSLWVAFAIMVILRNRFSSISVHCAYLWTYSLAYCSFAVVPIQYMILDRRFLILAYRKCIRKSQSRVSAKDGSSQIDTFRKDFSTVHPQTNKRKEQRTVHHIPLQEKNKGSNVVVPIN